jgi:hypothetical protein
MIRSSEYCRTGYLKPRSNKNQRRTQPSNDTQAEDDQDNDKPETSKQDRVRMSKESKAEHDRSKLSQANLAKLKQLMHGADDASIDIDEEEGDVGPKNGTYETFNRRFTKDDAMLVKQLDQDRFITVFDANGGPSMVADYSSLGFGRLSLEQEKELYRETVARLQASAFQDAIQSAMLVDDDENSCDACRAAGRPCIPDFHGDISADPASVQASALAHRVESNALGLRPNVPYAELDPQARAEQAQATRRSLQVWPE